MSVTMRLGVVVVSLCITAALVWSGVGLTMLFMRWVSQHQGMAKAMQLLPVFVLPVIAFVLHRRRGRIRLTA